MRNYFNYFTEIEDYFVRKRAKNILVSPLDWSLIEVWKEQRIPLQVVLRAIDRSFESAEAKSGKKPKTLFYCHPAVMEEFAAYQEAMLGGGEGEERVQLSVGKGQVLAHLDRLLVALQEHPSPVVRERLKELNDIRKEASAGKLEAREIDRQLSEFGDRLAAILQEGLERSAIKELKKEVSRELRLHRKRLSDKMYKKLYENHFRRRLRQELDLPEFTLI